MRSELGSWPNGGAALKIVLRVSEHFLEVLFVGLRIDWLVEIGGSDHEFISHAVDGDMLAFVVRRQHIIDSVDVLVNEKISLDSLHVRVTEELCTCQPGAVYDDWLFESNNLFQSVKLPFDDFAAAQLSFCQQLLKQQVGDKQQRTEFQVFSLLAVLELHLHWIVFVYQEGSVYPAQLVFCGVVVVDLNRPDGAVPPMGDAFLVVLKRQLC